MNSMSYQLPDLLTFLTSISSDGDLHLNPSYHPTPSPPKSPTLTKLLLLLPHPHHTKTKNLQKTPKELLNEYNPGLLASIYVPFTSILKVEHENEEVMGVVWEWLGVCVLGVEECVRPGRIVGIDDGEGDDWIRECLTEISERLSKFIYTPTQTIEEYIQEILIASNHPPPQPPNSNNNNNNNNIIITQYLNWRIQLNGHRILSNLFLSPNHHHRYDRAIDLALQVSVCVTDLFAYNIHQAWHTNNTSTLNHLNLISFLLYYGSSEGDSEIMTLQAAINVTGEMIRQRMVLLQNELYHCVGNNQEGGGEGGKSSGGVLTNIFSSFFTTKESSSSTRNDKTDDDDDDDDNTIEIRKTIWNWVTGIIHWAYEVEYFSPDLEDVDEGEGKKKRKKKGGEIRDYGWVFLIPKEMS